MRDRHIHLGAAGGDARPVDWAMRTLYITERDNNYMTNPDAWGSGPYDYKAVAEWHLGLYDESLDAARAALALEPDNQRLQNNVDIIRRSNNAQ